MCKFDHSLIYGIYVYEPDGQRYDDGMMSVPESMLVRSSKMFRIYDFDLGFYQYLPGVIFCKPAK